MKIMLPILYHKPLWFVVQYITINNIDTSELFKALEQCKLIQKEIEKKWQEKLTRKTKRKK